MLRAAAALSPLLLIACQGPARLPLAAVADTGFVPCRSTVVPQPRGLAAVDGSRVFVGGRGGVYALRDQGHAIRDITPPSRRHADFRDLHAFGRRDVVAMIAGEPAELWRTEDGGMHWRCVLHDPRPGAFFDGIAFAGDFGALCADPLDGAFGVWTTIDRGDTWQAVPRELLPTPLPGEAAFAASGSCITIADDKRIAIVTGGAERARVLIGGADSPWTAHDLPLAAGNASRGAFALTRTAKGWLVVGGDYAAPQSTAGTAAFAPDLSGPWEVIDGIGGYRSAAIALPEGWLAVGSHGSSWSADGGYTWRQLPWSAHSLAVAPDGAVWACGSGGVVARWRRAPSQ